MTPRERGFPIGPFPPPQPIPALPPQARRRSSAPGQRLLCFSSFCPLGAEAMAGPFFSFSVALVFLGAWQLWGASGGALPSATAPAPSQGSSSHSLQYFYTSVSEPGQGLPQFITVGYVDNHLFFQYDSKSKKAQPRVPWMEKAGADYWNRETQNLKGTELTYRENLAILRSRFNQSGGFHTWQWMYGCELREDGSKGGFEQYAYDGRDFLTFDKETLTWTAADVPAQITKRKWDPNLARNQYKKAYLEEICIEWLQRYLDYGKEALLRTEPPVGKVTREAIEDGREDLICQAHGFYPREIETTWRKGEEILEHETFRRNVAPNSDGTYHAWLSIEIDPKERNLYQCHVDHASLPKPLVLAFEEPGVDVGLIVGAILGVIGAVLLVAGIFFFFKKRREKAAYEAASTSDKSSDSSTRQA